MKFRKFLFLISIINYSSRNPFGLRFHKAIHELQKAPLSIAIKLKGIDLELLRDELKESAFEIEEKHMPLTMRQQKNLRRSLRLAKESEYEENFGNDSDEVSNVDRFWTSESEKIESASWKLDRKLGRFSLKRNKIQNYIAQIDKEC